MTLWTSRNLRPFSDSYSFSRFWRMSAIFLPICSNMDLSECWQSIPMNMIIARTMFNIVIHIFGCIYSVASATNGSSGGPRRALYREAIGCVGRHSQRMHCPPLLHTLCFWFVDINQFKISTYRIILHIQKHLPTFL